MSDPHRSSHPVRWLQDRVARGFDIGAEERTARVSTLLERSRGSSGSYWLQLVLAMAIATLGLTLDSTAVVIGAMLVSPLMAPIVELGMGLAVGSPVLVIRSFARVIKSIVAVIGGAAALTTVLPFHELTSEVAARTSPTALDLLVAICCAIAAAYAQVRPGSDTTSTAAGTAIGIALVPPLCVVGYGLGTRSASIAGGAALLFVANFCAIVLFAVICFLLLGFDTADVRALERAELAESARGPVQALARVFASRRGWLLRVLMPVALVAAVYVPLNRALREVSWEVRVRREIDGILAALPVQTVHSSLTVKAHAISLRIVAVGRPDDVEKLRADLARRIEAVAHVTPKVDVLAVANSDALRREVVQPPPPPAAVSPPPPPPPVDRARAIVASELARSWPGEAAGALGAWSLSTDDKGDVRLQVVHLGGVLGDAAREMLGRAIAKSLEATVAIDDAAVPKTTFTADDRAALLNAVAPYVASVARLPGVSVCVTSAEDATVASDPALSALATRVRVSRGDRWELRFVDGACPEPEPDAGVDADGDVGAGTNLPH